MQTTFLSYSERGCPGPANLYAPFGWADLQILPPDWGVENRRTRTAPPQLGRPIRQALAAPNFSEERFDEVVRALKKSRDFLLMDGPADETSLDPVWTLRGF